MKKINTLLAFCAMLMLTVLSFSSCEFYIDGEYDGDRSRANVISGEWQGDFGMFYTAVNPFTQRATQFDATHSYILFQSDYWNARRGTGKQIDFYNYGPVRQRYQHFVWEVHGRVLHINNPGEPALNVRIYDYELNNRYFTGYAGNSRFQFNLRKLNYGLWGNYALSDFDDPFDAWSWNGIRGTVQTLENKENKENLHAPQLQVVGSRK